MDPILEQLALAHHKIKIIESKLKAVDVVQETSYIFAGVAMSKPKSLGYIHRTESSPLELTWAALQGFETKESVIVLCRLSFGPAQIELSLPRCSHVTVSFNCLTKNWNLQWQFLDAAPHYDLVQRFQDDFPTPELFDLKRPPFLNDTRSFRTIRFLGVEIKRHKQQTAKRNLVSATP